MPAPVAKPEAGADMIPLRTLALAALLAVAALAACDDGGDLGKAVPFTRQSLDGRSVDLRNDGDGKVVLLHFWSAGTPGSDALLAPLQALWRERHDRGLLVVAVDIGDSRERAAAAIVGRGLDFPLVADPDASLAHAYGIADTPASVLIDRDGRVRKRIPGGVPFQVLRSSIETLL